MRGGLDDALDRLARRDELRRRAAGEATGTPPAVTELVEAIAGVVGRNPELAVTVGVEGAGDPVLLHFGVEDGIVQVRADNSVAQRAAEPAHEDYIDIDLVEEAEPEPYAPPNGYVFGSPVGPPVMEPDPTGSHRYEEPQPHPFAATPPPEVPPQTTRPIHPEQHRAPQEPSAAERAPEPPLGMPTPLPEPVPLRVSEEETEMAARRLAALLREDPSLLRAQD
ncbi:hypothetical protein ACPCHT_36015 [Nucisporomicrobium flavum]|uniref:hypothetical protein n=1 Tax=Nucisporomicrobium flavum TaxID=2785915 RepID=UPI0018F5D8D1|nr:hypothetical protein [Nucisporomicrobium flavum]